MVAISLVAVAFDVGGGHRVGDPSGTIRLQAEMQAESYGNGATTVQLKEREGEIHRNQGRQSRETSTLRLKVDASRKDRSVPVAAGIDAKKLRQSQNVTNWRAFAWQGCQWCVGFGGGV